MEYSGAGRIRQYLTGDGRPRSALVGAVVGLLGLASGAFLLGMNVGLFEFSGGWIVVALGIAVVAGAVEAGLGPTVGSLWLVSLWWYTFPPLVGYLGGEWTMASRYTHPRMAGFAYSSARAELIGGLESGVTVGLLFAVVAGTVAYVGGVLVGTILTWARAR